MCLAGAGGVEFRVVQGGLHGPARRPPCFADEPAGVPVQHGYVDLTVPRDLEDAARIEGCGTLGVLWRVYVPLADLQRHYGMSYIFISHDLAVVRAMSHRVMVMKNGDVVEEAETLALFEQLLHLGAVLAVQRPEGRGLGLGQDGLDSRHERFPSDLVRV